MTQNRSTTTELTGRGASAGIAIGALYQPAAVAVGAEAEESIEDSRRHLRDAIAASGKQLASLLESLSNSEESGIIEFQVAMLEDEALSESAFAAIENGTAAAVAWRDALNQQISDYRSSADEYFAARAADLEDIRNRVLENLRGAHSATVADSAMVDGSIIIASDLSPSRFLEIDWNSAAGIVLREGSHLSHVAILARARGVPMVVGVGNDDTTAHGDAIVDGDSGKVVLSPDAATSESYRLRKKQDAAKQQADRQYLSKDAVTVDGHAVKVMINVSDIAELRSVNCAHCDGIGLMRSEFLLGDRQTLLSEQKQYAAYRQMLEWAQGRPVTIRTLDAGGDKPVEGVTEAHESNPFLGRRGLRLSLAKSDIFAIQCRALARAAVHGNLSVMFPMVTHVSEFQEAVALFDQAITDLQSQQVPCQRPALGLMLEVPSALLAIEQFTQAEFFSVGSNDLLHYLSATSRDDESLQVLAQRCEPLMWDLIRMSKQRISGSQRSISLCGDAAADEDQLQSILGAGITTLSVSIARLAATKAAVTRIDLRRHGDG